MSDRGEHGHFAAGNKAGKQFTEGNQAHLVHGGSAAVRDLASGAPFSGLAAQTEIEIRQELADLGTVEMIRREAVRLATATRLYWNAVQAAVDGQDLEQFDRYIRRYGWLASATLRAWAQLSKAEEDAPSSLDYDQLVQELRDNGR